MIGEGYGSAGQFPFVDRINLASGNTRRIYQSGLRDRAETIVELSGPTADMAKKLGLRPDWAFQVIKQVGNYGEVFERNLGESSKLKIKRGVNALWTKNGLQYAYPIR